MIDDNSSNQKPWIVPVLVAIIGATSTVAVAWINNPLTFSPPQEKERLEGESQRKRLEEESQRIEAQRKRLEEEAQRIEAETERLAKEVQQQRIIHLIKDWLENGKNEAFGNYNEQIVSKYTIGQYKERNLKTIKDLKKNNAYIKYYSPKLTPVSPLVVEGNQATIKLEIQEKY